MTIWPFLAVEEHWGDMVLFVLSIIIMMSSRSFLIRMADMSDTSEDDNQEELEWLLFELDQAREDQRASLDHIVWIMD